MSVEEKTGPVGEVFIVIKDKDGTVIREIHEKNLIVNLGRTALAEQLGAERTNRFISQIRFGTNGTPPATTDTSISNAFSKSIGTPSYPSAGIVDFPFSLGLSEGNGLEIREIGLFMANGNLFSRRVLSLISKTSDFSITGTWRITF